MHHHVWAKLGLAKPTPPLGLDVIADPWNEDGREQLGIISRAAHDILEQLQRESGGERTQRHVWVTFVQIYLDHVYDFTDAFWKRRSNG